MGSEMCIRDRLLFEEKNPMQWDCPLTSLPVRKFAVALVNAGNVHPGGEILLDPARSLVCA